MSRNTRFLTLCSLAAIGVSLSACSSLPSASSLWPFGGDDKRDIAETIEINQPDLPTTTQAIDLAAAQTALRTNAPKTMEDSVALMNDQGVKVFGFRRVAQNFRASGKSVLSVEGYARIIAQ